MSGNKSDIEIYILHVRQGYEDRELFMKQQLERLGLAFQWVLEHDMGDLDEAQLAKQFGGEMVGIRPEVSCAMKHIQAWRNIADSEQNGGLILEDDMILDKDFGQKLDQFLIECQSQSDFPEAFMLSLENSTLSFVPKDRIQPGRQIYPANRMRCAGAYYLSKKGAHQLLRLAKDPINKPIDWWMGEQTDVAIFWSHPTIAEQGSHNGMFASGIDNKSGSLLRRISFAVQKWLKSPKSIRK